MAKARIVWNMAGFAAIRTSGEAMGLLNQHAQRIAAAAGEGFEAKPAQATGGRIRGRAAVVTTTYEAMRRQAKDHVLERSL